MFCTDLDLLKKYRTEKRLWQGIPGIEVTKKGRIFSTFYSGGINEQIGNFVVLLKSDNGIDFSEPIAAAYEPGRRCYDACLWIDPLDRLWFTWACAPDHAVYATVCEDPDADNIKWGAVTKIGNDVMMNKPTVLKNGEWIFPIAVWKNDVIAAGVGCSEDSDRKAFAYLSRDDGKTFCKLGGVDAERRSYDEHMIVEKEDESMAMYIRTFYGIAVSYSYDGGRNWTEATDSGLGGPCSRFHIRRLKSGRLLLVNHYKFSGRNNLTAMLSEDDGKTWNYKLLLDDRMDVSYPDVKEADDGYLYITYDRERGSGKRTLKEVYSCAREILMAKITESDIIAERIISKDSKLKVVISKLGIYSDENNNPYAEIKRYSDAEICDILLDKTTDEIIKILFESYEINCINMHKLDNKKMDGLIEKLKDGCSDRKEVIFELLRLVRNVDINSKEDIPIILRTKEIIEKRISENISLDEIADSMNMSKFYLCHLFKKRANMTLTDWKNYLKIKKAKELLANSDLKITDVAFECGFSNASYFSEIFTKSEKISPTGYRDVLRETRKEENMISGNKES